MGWCPANQKEGLLSAFHLGLIHVAICRHRELGYSKQGSIRTSTLHILGLSVDAINMSPFTVSTARSTEILVGVECLRAGQMACTADLHGNIGSGNKGKDNFGSNNVGDHNIGELHSGRW